MIYEETYFLQCMYFILILSEDSAWVVWSLFSCNYFSFSLASHEKSSINCTVWGMWVWTGTRSEPDTLEWLQKQNCTSYPLGKLGVD